MVSFSRFVFLACVAVACVAGLQATSADARVLSELKGGVAKAADAKVAALLETAATPPVATGRRLTSWSDWFGGGSCWWCHGSDSSSGSWDSSSGHSWHSGSSDSSGSSGSDSSSSSSDSSHRSGGSGHSWGSSGHQSG